MPACLRKYIFVSLLLFFAPFLRAQIGPIVKPEIKHDVSPAVRDLPTVAASAAIVHEVKPLRRLPLPPGLKPQQEPDAVQQGAVSFSGLLAPAVSLGFDGIGATGVSPPDPNGAVGFTQYVQWVNTSFAVYNKSNGALIKGPVAGNSLWRGFGGGCETNNDGDPIVMYDQLANRWVFAQLSVSTTPFLQCVAVSTTSDATGTYNRYSFQYSNFNDYPKMGIWPDAYYVTFNMFTSATGPFVGADACAYDRNAMLNGQAATQVCFQQGSSVGGLLPSYLDGQTPPPSGSPNFMLFFGSNSLNLFKFHVDFLHPGNSTFTGPTSIPVAAFTPLCNGGTCVPQAGTTQLLDSLADRLMYRLAYRNFGNHESLVVNHSVATGSTGGVRWYEVQNPNGTPTVVQQSTFAPDSNIRWMGSIAMDKFGDMAVGYSVSSGSMNPAIAFTGRVPSDQTSTMEAETRIINGTGSQTGGLSRWGDYTAMQVDPSDDCTFWYTNEYYSTSGSGNWRTRIANFKFPSCVPTSLGALASQVDTVTNAPEVYYVGADQHVHQLSWNTSGWHTFDLTANIGGPNVGTGAAMTDLMDTVVIAPEVYYVGTDQHIHQYSFNSTSGWHQFDLSGLTGPTTAAFGPRTASSMVDTVTTAPETYFIGTDQDIHVLIFNSTSGWGIADLSQLTGAPPAGATGALGTIIDRAVNAPEAYYVGTDQHVHQLYWNSTTGWHHLDISGSIGALNVSSGGALATLMDTLTNSPEAYYVGTDQHVHVVLWNSVTGWGKADISALANAPVPVATSGSLTAIMNTFSGDPEVYYVGSDQHIHQLFFNGSSWQHFDVGGFTVALNAANGSAITSMMDTVVGALEVYYVGTDQHIHQLTWNPTNGWHTFDIGL